MRTLLCLILLAASLSQAGEPLTAAPSPAITLKSPGPKAVVSVPPLPDLQLDRFRWFGLDNHQGPITWEMEGDAAGFVEFATAAKVFGKTDTSGDEPVFSEVPAGSVVLWGRKPGDVKLSAWGVVDGRAKRLATIVLTVEGARPPPKPVDPPKPVEPPKKAGLYFLIIQPDGPTQNTVLESLRLPAWDELTNAGNTYKPKSVSEAKSLGVNLPDGTALPCVVPLTISQDGKSSKPIPPPLPFPTTNEGVRKLMEVKP
jgi:hypothetical protein